MIRNLLIDLDGTLIHSGTPLTQLKFILAILPELKKLPTVPKQNWITAYRNLRSLSKALRADEPEFTNLKRMTRVLENDLNISTHLSESLLLNALRIAYPSIRRDFTPLTGASDFLAWAKQHFKLFLATNPAWPKDLVEMRMNWGGINPGLFESITTFDRMHHCKPSPNYYLEILKHEGLSPDECIHIGNEIKMDLPATVAGIPVFIVDQALPQIRLMQTDAEARAQAWTGNWSALQKLLAKELV